MVQRGGSGRANVRADDDIDLAFAVTELLRGEGTLNGLRQRLAKPPGKPLVIEATAHGM